ncbi:acylneuraminate cytidylyltransferase family protein [Arcicella sp. LKC2W]|uniref:acylneuraminate cytidylyltransferase family protein n=1 Tax=Arcicella sp. LKC2W TaxID=2984198 RepID=UPI002B2118A0|nr:acylneuraminate cytidylyltransferase family protein [Arcicella sp. LKC2W]MEA5459175.1 acylneuraminate cytidylyltransferase family protein [Arcicella sp. LKC2W]
MKISDTLFIIPARGGSKGIPRKNIKSLAGKPLIHYSIDYARLFTEDENICLSTDDQEIIECANQINLAVPFVRPLEFSTDTASTFAVLHHAISFYQAQRKYYKYLVLLQPTSPFREGKHLAEAFELMDSESDVTVSVVQEHNNPYFNVFEENQNGFLKISKGDGNYTRRQDCPPVYAFNGSIYIFSISSLLKANSFKDFVNIKKYVMDEKYKVDLDTINDWNYCEYLLQLNNQ